MMKIADRVVAYCLIILGILVFWQASKITFFSDELLGPAFFPKFLAGVLIFLGILLFLRTFWVADFPVIDLDSRGIEKIILVILMSIIYLATIEPVGFLITTPLLMFVLMMILKRGSLQSKIVFSMIFPIVSWVIFRSFLKIPLPWGVLD